MFNVSITDIFDEIILPLTVRVLLFHDKFDVVIIGSVLLPINKCPNGKILQPVPPLETPITPTMLLEIIFEIFAPSP